MDQELISFLDQRFRETSRQIEGLREETMQRFEQVEEGIRHTRVVVEGLRGDIQAVAEGFMGLDERLGAFQRNVATDLRKVEASVRTPFEFLDHRLRTLETRAENEGKDPVAIVRERFGKRPEQA